MELDAYALRDSGKHADAEPSWTVVNRKQTTVDSGKKWLYAATDTDSKLLLEVNVFSRHEIDP